MSPLADSVRALYYALIGKLVLAGARDAAMECARLAVKQGVWIDPFQRPLHFVPDIPASPTYERERLPEAAYLECHFPTIRAELDRVTDPQAAGFTSVAGSSLLEGRWDQVIFYEGGTRYSHAASLFPNTAAILDALPDRTRNAGWIMFSWLQPGSHIAAHCGYSNARLRIHLGIRTPPGAEMRVKDQTFTWREGECLVFDDSFQHEVWHRGAEPRVVLLVDVFHPSLPDAERRALLLQRKADTANRLRSLMQQHGFRHVSRSAEAGLTFELDETTERTISHFMRDAGIRSVDLGVEGDLEPAVEYEA
jgi:aspartate beta-hydroxylase